jgi:glycosyltransferase involved in cell wall biosynthesis
MTEGAGDPVARRHVLTLAYHFPPVGGAGVQRMTQLARRLHDLGCEQTVITGPGGPESRWRPRDESVEVGGGTVRVLRMAGPEPPHDVRWEGRRERWLRMSSRWRRWWSANVLELARTLDHDVDVVHASLAPYSTAESSVAVARMLGKPLLLDLEDPWALDEMMVYPTRLHRRLELRRMRGALTSSTVVVMNTPEARARVLRTFPTLSHDRVVSIPNAFDPIEFAAAATPAGRDGRFKVVHAGSLHTEMGRRHREAGTLRRTLGGAVPGVDFLPRSHVFLLEAVRALLDEQPELRDVIEIHLAGVFTDEDRAVAAEHPYVRLHEFLPHHETLPMLTSADVLFLPMHDLPAGRRAGLIPQKTYEYLAAGRPILAAVPDGDARDLLARAGVAHVCRPTDVDAMIAALRQELERWRSGAAPASVPPEILEHCAADRLAADFVRLYSTLSSAPAAVLA